MRVLERSARLALLAALLLATGEPIPAHAQGRPMPVNVDVMPLFGADVVRPRTWVPILVTLQNTTQRTFQGELHLEVKSWRAEALSHETRVDLPAGASRRVVIDVFLPDDGSELFAQYVVEGGIAGRRGFTSPYSSGGAGIVILARESRLRSVLGAIDSTTTDEYGSMREVNMPVGSVAFDPTTGDPLAPETSLGYAPVSLVIARSSELEALSPTQREALRNWVAAGGQLFVFPRTPEAAQQPYLRSLVGEVELRESEPVPGRFDAMPRTRLAETWVPRDDSEWIDEAFGGSRRLGFGRVYLATYDGTVPPHVDAGYTQATLRAVAQTGRARVNDPMFAFAEPEQQALGWGGGVNTGFQELRAALDPNESFRPALGFVALLLLVYVILVGPVNFRWVAKKNRPIFALVTTPIAAFGCLFLMLVVGYIGKGVTMRYRSVEVVEAVAGEPLAPTRGYLSLFLTRPTSFDLDEARGRRLLPEGSPRMPHVVTDGTDRRMTDLQGGLWETLFLREDRVRDLRGAVTFDVENLRLVAVDNGTQLTLRDAILVAPGGGVYSVGDIAPGASAPIGGQPIVTLTEDEWYWGVGSADNRALAQSLGVDTPEGRKTIYGLVSLGGGRVQAVSPLLIARIEESDGDIAGTFSEEQSLHLLRVVVPNPEPMIHVRQDYLPEPYPEPYPGEMAVDGAMGEPMVDTPDDLFEGVGEKAP